MNEEQSRFLVEELRKRDIHFEHGLEESEINAIQYKYNFSFPPDLRKFLMTALPLSDGFYDWRLGLYDRDVADMIRARLRWPLESILIDVQKNNFWFKGWGKLAESIEERKRICEYNFKTYPILVPIYSLCFIPAYPREEGNPVYSVYGSDIIYYGNDLSSYLSNEFKFELSSIFNNPGTSKQDIPFWSEVAS